ncbi:hypothetical protein [Bradyrhizobium glycinis]|uniref:hypothetical protein n=1 Tax=Bradyrhizobium glycinis TaxID=2751812 RepID=UPI0018D8EF33|nr:hypothetical protein [Bradyrhizobium glycinis]MBH5372258.1 hypothetical protein [Bradyrhizobium glycinis]
MPNTNQTGSDPQDPAQDLTNSSDASAPVGVQLDPQVERALFITFWKWLGIVGSLVVAAVTAVSVLVSQVVLETARSSSESEARKRLDELSARIKDINDQSIATRKESTDSLGAIYQARGRSDEVLKNALAQLDEANSTIKKLKELHEANKAVLSAPADVADALAKNRDFVTLVQSTLDSIYAGAIVTFDRECPSGWSMYSQAGGRFIIGAGEHKNTDAANRALTVYAGTKTGGEQDHRLAAAELPSHQHDTLWAFWTLKGGGGSVM